MALSPALTGCGADEEVAANATVSVYAAAPLCAGAKHEAARDDDRAGGLRVRVICLAAAERGGKLDLAAIGANARRATEDSTTVGYIGEPTAAATRFSAPILEAAGIAQLSAMPGGFAMQRVLDAIDEAGSSDSPRSAVYDELR